MKIEEPKTLRIQPSDIVSGQMYLKLIEDYKVYDKKQKEYISSLLSKLSEMTEVLEKTQSGAVVKLYERLERRKKTIVSFQKKIKSLKEENNRLLSENIKLKLKL